MKSFEEEIQSNKLRESLTRLVKSKYPYLTEHIEDIIQESLIYCWKNKNKFKGECSLITWVWTKANWIIIDLHKDNHKEHLRNEKIKEEYYYNNKYKEMTSYILTKETIEKIVNKTLTKSRKDIVNKILIEGMSIEQYSKEKSINKITVKTNIHKARRTITNYITSHNIPDIIY